MELLEAITQTSPGLRLGKYGVWKVNTQFVLLHVEPTSSIQPRITYIDTYQHLQAAVNGFLLDAGIEP